jgi:hypothetical protein
MATAQGLQDAGGVEVRLPLLDRGHAAVSTLVHRRLSIFNSPKRVT